MKSKDKDPVLSLKATKEIIEENLKLDERNLKLRSPKRHLLSEERWGEASTWDDIISEGKDRKKELALQTLRPKNVTKPDKAMTLQVPGSEPSEPIIKEKPPPNGYVRRLSVLVESGCTCSPKYSRPGSEPNPASIIPSF